jgi:hypothetical protein
VWVQRSGREQCKLLTGGQGVPGYCARLAQRIRLGGGMSKDEAFCCGMDEKAERCRIRAREDGVMEGVRGLARLFRRSGRSAERAEGFRVGCLGGIVGLEVLVAGKRRCQGPYR